MSRYIMRLDDACEKMDIAKWSRMEQLLDQYGIQPLVGVIPDCKDPMMDSYPADPEFWNKVHTWQEKGWEIALHGCTHVYSTECGGLNPVNARSEFAGEPLEVQREKIRRGVSIFREHGIEPKVFFAPSHTFDENTLEALKQESNIRIISDTPANKPYQRFGMTFVPQQSGAVRRLPFHTVTFCYHPNTMTDESFSALENFLKENPGRFTAFPAATVKCRRSAMDSIVRFLYFIRRKI